MSDLQNLQDLIDKWDKHHRPNDPFMKSFVEAARKYANPDIEAAGKAAWYVVASEKGRQRRSKISRSTVGLRLVDEGWEWEDLIASDSQSFWIDVGKAAVDAALSVTEDE